MKHTYQLIDAIISKEARVQKHEKKKRNKQIVSFKKLLLCVPFSLLSRLDEPSHVTKFLCSSELLTIL